MLAGAALPAHDPTGEGVDGERGVDEHPGREAHVGEVGDHQYVRRRHRELAVHQIGRAGGVRVGLGGADLLGPNDPVPAIGPHEPFHGAAGHLDALPVQVGPHLGGPIQALRLAPAVLVGLVVAGQDLGDRHVPQGPLRRLARLPGVERSRGDLAAVLAEHPADRNDPEPSAMLGNERTDQRCRGSLARTKKLVAAFRISIVSSSSRFFFRSSRNSWDSLVVIPAAWPSSTSA